MSEEKMIRFIDSHYNSLFYIPDGGNVVLTFSDGEKAIRPCKFLDESHTQVGCNVYHICQFAELMEQNGTAYTPEKPVPLPKLCYSTLPATGELILLVQGEKGYHKCDSAPHREQNEMTAAQKNRCMGVTPQQEAAMMGGAMRGWSTPAARTNSYDLKGIPVVQKRGRTQKPREPVR